MVLPKTYHSFFDTSLKLIYPLHQHQLGIEHGRAARRPLFPDLEQSQVKNLDSKLKAEYFCDIFRLDLAADQQPTEVDQFFRRRDFPIVATALHKLGPNLPTAEQIRHRL